MIVIEAKRQRQVASNRPGPNLNQGIGGSVVSSDIIKHTLKTSYAHNVDCLVTGYEMHMLTSKTNI